MGSVKEVNEGVILEIKARPNSAETGLYRKDDSLILEIRSEPENNKANLEIVSYFEKLFGEHVKILKGFKQKNKVIFIKNVCSKDVEKLFL